MRWSRALVAQLAGLCCLAAAAAPAAETAPHEMMADGGFETTPHGWTAAGDFHADARFRTARSGAGYAYLSGPDGDPANGLSGELYQTVTLPADASSAALSFWYNITTRETADGARDQLLVTVRDAEGERLATVTTLSNLDRRPRGDYRQWRFDLSPFRGRTVRIHFAATTDDARPTTFRIDDVSLSVTRDGEKKISRSAPPPAPRPPSAEERALAAETDGRWAEARSLYRQLLAATPDRGELWLRLADVEAALGEATAAAESTARAAALAPDDAALQFRLAGAWATASEREMALAAAERAVTLEPDNVEYLKGRARLANWNGRYPLANDSYERVLHQRQDDPEALLGRARTAAWQGRTDRAVELYRFYLDRYPEDATARLELARAEGWRGNYPVAVAVLEEQRARFGESAGYLRELASALTGAERPNAALEILEPQLARSPDDLHLHRLYVLALAESGRSRQALEELETVIVLDADNPETEILRRVVETPMRSAVVPRFDLYHDSDSVDRRQLGLDADLSLTPSTRLLLGGYSQELTADPGSGLAARLTDLVRSDGLWLGLGQRLSPKARLRARLGGERVEDGRELLTYRLGFELKPSDVLSLDLSRRRDFYTVSPRALELGIERTANQLLARWGPGARYRVEAIAGYDTYSDGNRRLELVLAPRRAILRRARFNLDLGLRGWWFRFDEDLANGYYDPGDYRRYSVTGFAYWKVNDEAGIAFTLAAGLLKDDSMQDYRLGGDATVEVFVGIYRDWMLQLRATSSENTRSESGAFNAQSFALLLTRRL